MATLFQEKDTLQHALGNKYGVLIVLFRYTF